jgi:hypothetical protein
MIPSCGTRRSRQRRRAVEPGRFCVHASAPRYSCRTQARFTRIQSRWTIHSGRALDTSKRCRNWGIGFICGTQQSSQFFFVFQTRLSRANLPLELCLRNAVRRAGTGTEADGSKECRTEEGAVDCTEIVLRRWGFESMLMEETGAT